MSDKLIKGDWRNINEMCDYKYIHYTSNPM